MCKLLQVWYTDSKALHIKRLYAQALLSAVSLSKRGIAEVPHVVREEAVYERLLQGIPPKEHELGFPRPQPPMELDVQDARLVARDDLQGPRAPPLARVSPHPELASGASASGPASSTSVPLARVNSVEPLETDHKWGVFTITPRQATTRCRFGSWTANCPFHKKSIKSGCKKEMVIPSRFRGRQTQDTHGLASLVQHGSPVQHAVAACSVPS